MISRIHYVEKEKFGAVCLVCYNLCVGGKEYNVYAYICIDYFWKNIQEVGMVAFSRGKEVARETEVRDLFVH